MSKKVGYLYPAWADAKRKLFEQVDKYILDDKQSAQVLKIISTWFENFVFEIGVQSCIRIEYKGQDGWEKEIEILAARRIAEEILSQGLFQRRHIRQRGFEDIFEYRIVVCGAPPNGVGPAKRTEL